MVILKKTFVGLLVIAFLIAVVALLAVVFKFIVESYVVTSALTYIFERPFLGLALITSPFVLRLAYAIGHDVLSSEKSE